MRRVKWGREERRSERTATKQLKGREWAETSRDRRRQRERQRESEKQGNSWPCPEHTETTIKINWLIESRACLCVCKCVCVCLCPGSTPRSRHLCAAKVSLGLPPCQGQCRHTPTHTQTRAWHGISQWERQRNGEREKERYGGKTNNRVMIFKK